MHLSACSRTLFPEVAFHAKTIANKHKQKQTKSPTVCREHSKITYLQSAFGAHSQRIVSVVLRSNPLKPPATAW